MSKAKVYIIEDQSFFDERTITEISKLIPPSRLEKASRYRRSIDRKNCILVYCLLMYGLKKDFGIENVPEISTGKYGKPYFPGSMISFSMSHSDKGVCCGIADCNIGADIQDTDIRYKEISDMVMSEKEKESIFASSFPQTEFARFWTLKESLLKYRGTGLINDMKSIDFSGAEGDIFTYDGLMFRSEKTKTFCVSACANGLYPEFERIDSFSRELF